MSLVQTVSGVEYPESDGQPMGETDLHRNWMIRIFDMLRYRYRGQRVYVACNFLVYYEQGEPSRYVVPDEFVVKNCDPGERRVFKIWEEGTAPDVAIEVTSRSTRNEDTTHKPVRYAEIGIQEYFLYDPTSEYMSPALQGFRLEGHKYTTIEPDESGALECRQLELSLQLEEGKLVIWDIASGEPLKTASEAAEARAIAAEQEVERLRKRLKELGDDDS